MNFSLISRCFAIVLLFIPHASADTFHCLAYEPTETTITGKLVRLVFPGRPNYESIAKGDESETHYYLVPALPICTDGDINSAAAYPQRDVKLVQLVLEPNQHKELSPLLGKETSLVGSLFAAHTAHHHAPLLLRVSKLPPAQ